MKLKKIFFAVLGYVILITLSNFTDKDTLLLKLLNPSIIAFSWFGIFLVVDAIIILVKEEIKNKKSKEENDRKWNEIKNKQDEK